jgi:hypothetical protein
LWLFSAWVKPHPYVFVVVTFGLAAVQLSFLNRGLAISETIKYLPVYNALLILFATFYGALYYKEYEDWSAIGMVMFPLGCAVVMAGVLTLTLGGKKKRHKVNPDAELLSEDDEESTNTELAALTGRQTGGGGGIGGGGVGIGGGGVGVGGDGDGDDDSARGQSESSSPSPVATPVAPPGGGGGGDPTEGAEGAPPPAGQGAAVEGAAEGNSVDVSPGPDSAAASTTPRKMLPPLSGPGLSPARPVGKVPLPPLAAKSVLPPLDINRQVAPLPAQ